MQKSNTIEYPVLKEIENRKSIRAFKHQTIEIEKIHSLFEAARWSFSSSNEQAWTYIYAQKNQPLWNDLLSCLSESNQAWCKDADMLILTLAKKLTSRDKPYIHNFHDVGASCMAMALQATSLGLQIHPMGGYDSAKAKSTFNIPDMFETVTMIAVGYPSNNISHLKEHHQKAETERSERILQSSFVMNAKF
jgi:nitroreductase